MKGARRKSKTFRVYSPKWLEAAMEAGDCHASELARRLETTPNSVSRWRRGVTPITYMISIAVLVVLELPLDWSPPSKSADSK